MGYAVGQRNGRWVGYGVPAYCDMPECSEEINRGLDYWCEYHGDSEYMEGCGLFFCPNHLYKWEAHLTREVQPKPDHPDWVHHILTDESWEAWRAENPAEVSRMTK